MLAGSYAQTIHGPDNHVFESRLNMFEGQSSFNDIARWNLLVLVLAIGSFGLPK